MSWLSPLTFWMAFGSLLCGTANCLYSCRYAALSPSRPRSVGAFALALVNAGFAFEAALFIALAHPGSMAAPALVAAACVRLLLLAAAAFISVLVIRSSRSPRER